MALNKKRIAALIASVMCLNVAFTAMPASAVAEDTSLGTIQRTEPKTYKSEAEGKTLYVSPDGNDNNPGTLEAPLKTITKARDTVRGMIATGMSENVTVYIRGGSYYLDKPITFTPDDSGKDGYKVIYKAYEDETPEICGGQALTGWEPYQNGIYRTKVSNGTIFNTLVENGERSWLARYPNKGLVREGWLKVAETAESNFNYQFKFADGDFPEISNTSELQVNTWPGGTGGEFNWVQEIIDVASLDYDANTIALAAAANYEMGKGSRYFLQGALELLDTPGEFYIDTTENYVYYYPKSLPINEQEIVYPKMYDIIQFTGAGSTSPVKDIQLEGLNIQGSNSAHSKSVSADGALINMKYAEAITVKDCELSNAGIYGIYISPWGHHNYVTGCYIHNCGSNGISTFPGWQIDQVMIDQNIFTNNLIHDCGEIIGDSAMITIANSGQNYVANNTLYNGGRFALNIGNQCVLGNLLGMTLGGTLVTKDNMWDFQFARENVIEYNDMSNVMTDSQDGGVFYSWGAGKDNWLNNNWLHDSGIHFSFGFGMYLDDESCYYDLTNNIVSNLQQHGEEGTLNGAYYVKGWKNEVYNNFAINNGSRNGLMNGYDTDGHGPVHQLSFEHNVVYRSAVNDVHNSQGYRDDKYDLMDRNLYYQDSGIYTVGEGSGMTLEAYKSAYDQKYDQYSLAENPKFVNAEKDDYRLSYDSIAHAIGIKDIDTYSIGVNEGFKFIDENDPLKRLFVSSDTDGYVSYVNLDTASKQNAQLSVKGRSVIGFPYNMENTNISYTSSNPEVATVDESGKLTAVSTGKTTVTATVLPKKSELSASMKSRMENAMALIIGQSAAFINGEPATIDPENSSVVPVIRDDRTLVPLRFIAEGFGATVDWEEGSHTATITKDKVKIKMVIGQKTYNKNRRDYEMDVAPQIINDRTMIPLRAVSTALNKEVFWEGSNRLIVISDTPDFFNIANESVAINTLVKSFPVAQSIATTVLVNDQFSNVEAYCDRTTLKVGENVAMQAFPKTEQGRYLSADGGSVTYVSSDPKVASVSAEGMVTSNSVGKADITATVTLKDGTSKSGTLTFNVVDAIIDAMSTTLEQAALSPGDTTKVNVVGTLSDGRELDLSECTVTYASSNPEVLTVSQDGMATAVSQGSATLNVAVNRSGYLRRATLNVIVFPPAAELPAPWKVTNMGPAAGTVDYDATTDRYKMYSNGENVWDTTDRCTFFYQKVDGYTPGKTVTMEAHISTMTKASSDTSCGVMLRSSLDGDAKQIHVRLIPSGTNIIAFRTETGGSCGYAVGPNFTFPEGATLRVTYKDGTATFSYIGNGTVNEVGSIDIDFGGEIYAGVCSFSNNVEEVSEANFWSPVVTVQ